LLRFDQIFLLYLFLPPTSMLLFNVKPIMQVININLLVAQKHPGSSLEGFTGVQVSTLAVNEGLLVAGGFQGELICKVRY
jgi:hypothetical protein